MTMSSNALHGVILLQVISKAVSQFPVSFPYPGGPSPMMPQMPPLPPYMSGGMGSPVPSSFPMQQKMPMVVMPYYSKSADKAQKREKEKIRRRRPKKHYIEDSSDDDSSSSDEFNFRAKSNTRRRQVLTPVVSYVTKDGYVVYQKKIRKDKAKDWLEMGRKEQNSQEKEDVDERAELLRKLKKLKIRRSHKHRH